MSRQFSVLIISTALDTSCCNCQLWIPLPQVDSLNKCLQYSQEENIALKAKIAQVRIYTMICEELYLNVLTIGSVDIIAKAVPPT